MNRNRFDHCLLYLFRFSQGFWHFQMSLIHNGQWVRQAYHVMTLIQHKNIAKTNSVHLRYGPDNYSVPCVHYLDRTLGKFPPLQGILRSAESAHWRVIGLGGLGKGRGTNSAGPADLLGSPTSPKPHRHCLGSAYQQNRHWFYPLSLQDSIGSVSGRQIDSIDTVPLTLLDPSSSVYRVGTSCVFGFCYFVVAMVIDWPIGTHLLVINCRL